MMNIKEEVRTFLVKMTRQNNLKDDENIFQQRLVNSLFAMQLVLFIEKNFHIHIGQEDMDIANFQSVNSIVTLIERKIAQGSDI